MDCASCAKTIEQGVAQLEGVEGARVNFATETLEGHGTVAYDALRTRIEQLGYGVAEQPRARADVGRRNGFFEFAWSHGPTRRALIGGGAALATLPFVLTDVGAEVGVLIDAVYWIVIAIVGFPIAAKGVRALTFGRRITIEALMTLAVIGAVAIGAPGEAVTVIVLFAIGEALEAYSATRSRDAIHQLLKLAPNTATVIETHTEAGAAHRHLVKRSVNDLVIGDRIVIKPGERVPADGTIVEGASAVDESAITGEAIPVPRGIGEPVRAATINGDGTLEVEVTAEPQDFLITHIAKIVARAQAARSPAEAHVDRFAAWYTPCVVGLAISVAVLPPLVFGQPFVNPADGGTGWLYRGLALLIVACPCALILSIPVTVVSSLARLGALGILVKGGAELSALGRTRVFAFDKTGTLTHGLPTVSGVRARDCAHPRASLEDCAPCNALVAKAAAVESGSNHPLAAAVLKAATHRSIPVRHGQATAIQTHAGRGISGTVDGRRVTVGRPELFTAYAGGNAALDALLEGQTSRPSSLMVVAEDDVAVGYIEVADQIRPEATEALRALKSIDRGFRCVMLTGDRAETAQATAERIGGIDEIRSGLLPEQKLDAVRELESAHGAVAMIGDGINDTPALAGAQLGIAMGGAGSDQAMDVASIVLMQDDLTGLPRAVAIAREARRRIAENIVLSLGLKLVFLGLAIPGLATLWMAVLADVGTTLVVTLNGMRMLRADFTTRER